MNPVGWFRTLARLARDLFQAERSIAGRYNVLGTLGALGILILFAPIEVVQALVRIVRPGANLGFPYVQMFYGYLVAMLLCAGLLQYERGRQG